MDNKAFENFTLPAYESIPDVGLYLEQVVRYINSFFTDLPEMNVTASMVTNYVKQKLVAKTGRKTYSRGQLASFIFIAMSKTVLSMNHIRLLLGRAENDPEAFYSDFRDNMLKELGNLFREDDSATQGHLKAEGDALSKVCVAIGQKMYLERYFCELEGTDKKS